MGIDGGTLPSAQAVRLFDRLRDVSAGLAVSAVCRGVRKISGHEASGIALLEPILVPVWVFLAWGNAPTYQPPRWWTYVGGGLILLGLLLRYNPLATRRDTRPIADAETGEPRDLKHAAGHFGCLAGQLHRLFALSIMAAALPSWSCGPLPRSYAHVTPTADATPSIPGDDGCHPGSSLLRASHALAKGNRPGANDRLTVAHIGVGGMGSGHLQRMTEFRTEGRVNIAAVCDVHDGQSGQRGEDRRSGRATVSRLPVHPASATTSTPW